MNICIEQNVLEQIPNLQILRDNDTVLIRLDPNTFVFPKNLPMTNLDSVPWQLIKEIAYAGKAREYFALGATKKDYMKNGFVAEYQIIGFNHDDLANGNGKSPISFDLVTLYKDEIPMQKSGSSVYWENSDGRDFLNKEFFDLVSDELRSIIAPVWKYSANRNGEIVKTTDNMWLKSEKELHGRTIYSYAGEGNWYEFYAREDVPYYKMNANGEKDWQWLRSVYASNAAAFCYVYTSGAAISSYSGFSIGVSAGFCV